VACQLDYLCDCAHDAERREALKSLPPDLPESYRRLLERVNRCSPQVQRIVQLCLRFIAFARRPLTILELRQAVSIPEEAGSTLDASNTISEQEISRRCSSLIRKTKDNLYFEFAHFSVQEFLENEGALAGTSLQPGLQSYLIDRQDFEESLAAQCLRCLQLINFNRQPTEVIETELEVALERDKKYPFYKYSVRGWLDLTQRGLISPLLLDLARCLFHTSKTRYSSSWAIHLLYYLHVAGKRDDRTEESMRIACNIVLEPSFGPLQLAAAFNIPEICTILLDSGAAINARSGLARPLDLAMVSIWATGHFVDYRAGNVWATGQFVDYRAGNVLPTAERRNETLDCLISRGAKLSGHNFCGRSIFYSTCRLCSYFHDLTPITKLLSLGVIPGKLDIDALEYCLRACVPDDDERASPLETSSLHLVQYLTQSKLKESNWVSQVQSIVCEWALGWISPTLTIHHS